MAVASGSTNLGSASKKNEQLAAARSALDFYESMYHFKKMFPKLESDVIETILRANHGQVDKTLDQLLAITVDEELDLVRRDDTDKKTTSDGVINDDSPPPYHELMSSSSVTASNIESSDSFSSSFSPATASQPTNTPVVKNESESFLGGGLYSIDVREQWHSRAMVGELRRDFLRIKLTNEQLKKFKASIKKAKRDEITALVNNTVPERPKLSFELKRQMKELTGQMDLTDSENEQPNESNISRFDENLLINPQKRQVQFDEYIAKMIQKDEEIKRNQERSKLVDDIDLASIPNDFWRNHDASRSSNVGTNSKMRLEKSSSSSKILSKLNKEEETASISSNSTKSKPDDDSSGEESYDVERIKWLEEIGAKTDVGASGGGENRYKKVYKSFKKALKKSTPTASFITNSLGNIQKSRSSKKSIEFLDFTDHNNNMMGGNKDTEAIFGAKNDLVFEDYSYEEKPTNRKNF